MLKPKKRKAGDRHNAQLIERPLNHPRRLGDIKAPHNVTQSLQYTKGVKTCALETSMQEAQIKEEMLPPTLCTRTSNQFPMEPQKKARSWRRGTSSVHKLADRL